jgi:Coenzyme PQQ synthesis protein D (PqqD)
MRYQLNDHNVVSEVLDGEVIVIHLQTGTYYSMLASGADIWNALLNGWSVEEISDRLVQATALEHELIGVHVARFVTTLEGEELIRPTNGDPGTRRDEFLPGSAYAEPELLKYTDMQELLLVDPIHEVAEEGWPLRIEKDY